MLSKLSEYIPKFFNADVFPYGGSGLIVCKGAFGKVAPLEIDHMEIVVTCKTGTLKDVKIEMYVMQKVTGRQNFPCEEWSQV